MRLQLQNTFSIIKRFISFSLIALLISLSAKVSDDFNVTYDVYKKPQDIDAYIDGSLTTAK